MPGALDTIGGSAWYVMQLKPNCSAIAKRNLARIGCHVFAPYEEVTLRRGSQFRRAPRPLFPGYLFAGFDPASVPWRSVNSAYGVTRLVGFTSDRPATVPNSLLAGLMARCDPNGRLTTADMIGKGDQVRITSGPFANFVGIVETVDPQQRIWVLLEIMGGQRQVAVKACDTRITGERPPGRGTITGSTGPAGELARPRRSLR